MSEFAIKALVLGVFYAVVGYWRDETASGRAFTAWCRSLTLGFVLAFLLTPFVLIGLVAWYKAVH